MTAGAALLAILFAAGSPAILQMPGAFACGCAEPRPPGEAFDRSTAVFAGKVASIDSGNYGSAVRFDVERMWKGVTGDTVTVTTADSGDSCGYDFKKGAEYIVYVYGESPRVSLCSRTQPVAEHMWIWPLLAPAISLCRASRILPRTMPGP